VLQQEVDDFTVLLAHSVFLRFKTVPVLPVSVRHDLLVQPVSKLPQKHHDVLFWCCSPQTNSLDQAHLLCQFPDDCYLLEQVLALLLLLLVGAEGGVVALESQQQALVVVFLKERRVSVVMIHFGQHLFVGQLVEGTFELRQLLLELLVAEVELVCQLSLLGEDG
jgi:hypothetical protein